MAEVRSILFLIGQIAAGKSEIGRLIAKETGAQFVSIDDLRGQYDSLPTEWLCSFLQNESLHQKLIFECTGAAPNFEKIVRELYLDGAQTFVAMLDCSVETAMQRIRSRPQKLTPIDGGGWASPLRWTSAQLRLVPSDIYVSTDNATPSIVAKYIANAWSDLDCGGEYPIGNNSLGSFLLSASNSCRYAEVDSCLKSDQRFARQKDVAQLEKSLRQALSALHRSDKISVRSEDDLLRFFSENFRQRALVPASVDDAQAALNRGKNILKIYYRSAYERDKSKTLAVDMDCELFLSDGLSLSGTVDRVSIGPSGTIEVTEYELSDHRPTPNNRVPDMLALAASGSCVITAYQVRSVLLCKYNILSGERHVMALQQADIERVWLACLRWFFHLSRAECLQRC